MYSRTEFPEALKVGDIIQNSQAPTRVVERSERKERSSIPGA
jgi:hypothetical protein